MIRNYKNNKIYENLNITAKLSALALIVSIVSICVYLINKSMGNVAEAIERQGYMFYFFFVATPLGIFIFSIKHRNQKNQMKKCLTKETHLNNDLATLLTAIIFSFSPLIILFIYLLFGSMELVYSWVYCLGYMLFSHIFVYISNIFLINCYILVKREWKENSPAFKAKAKNIKQQYQKTKEFNRNYKIYAKLIQQCGAKFFIKYYLQISNLPLSDVVIQENYSFEEKKERLSAAKKIIDLNLTEFVVKQILKSYSDIFTESEKITAENILKSSIGEDKDERDIR